MAQIFISYAREDFKQVSELRLRLKDEGFTTWMDKVDLLAGQRWRPAIEQAVRESDFFVLCLSNRTVSKRSFVQREIKMALDLWQEMLTDDIFLIPVLLEHIQPEEIPVSIREIGLVFLFEEDGWDDLLRALRHGMKQRSIGEKDERKKEEDAVRQAAAEAARRNYARQQEEASRLKKEREAAELRRHAEAAQQQKERAERQQREANEQERVERLSLTEEAPHAKPQSSPTSTVRGKGFPLWPAVAGAILFVGLLWYWGWSAFQSSQVQQAADKPITTFNATPTPTPWTGQTFEFETVRLNASGGEVQRQKLQAEYFTENLNNRATLDMVKIPGGNDFTMGSPLTEVQRGSDEGPQHSVNISSFWMGKFEVTQKQWLAVMGKFTYSPDFRGDGLPVGGVAWNDAQRFLKTLNALPNLKGKNYRLPTEAEWEYAARANTATPFAFGETITPKIVNYDGNHPYAGAPKGPYRQKTVPVGSLGVANAFGLFDMHGSVWEWCHDVWHSDYNGARSDGLPWLSGGDSNSRVIRGGSWHSAGNVVRSAFRSSSTPGDTGTGDDMGFRVVCSRTP